MPNTYIHTVYWKTRCGVWAYASSTGNKDRIVIDRISVELKNAMTLTYQSDQQDPQGSYTKVTSLLALVNSYPIDQLADKKSFTASNFSTRLC